MLKTIYTKTAIINDSVHEYMFTVHWRIDNIGQEED